MKQVIPGQGDASQTQVIKNHHWHQTPIVPQVADTDYGGGIYHGKYFALYNQARDLFLTNIGFSYLSLMDQGLNLSVAELHTRFLKPIRYGEIIQVDTRIAWYRTRSMGVIQKMISPSPDSEIDSPRNVVELNLVCTNNNGEAQPLPHNLVKAIRSYYGMADSPFPDKPFS